MTLGNRGTDSKRYGCGSWTLRDMDPGVLWTLYVHVHVHVDMVPGHCRYMYILGMVPAFSILYFTYNDMHRWNING